MPETVIADVAMVNQSIEQIDVWEQWNEMVKFSQDTIERLSYES